MSDSHDDQDNTEVNPIRSSPVLKVEDASPSDADLQTPTPAQEEKEKEADTTTTTTTTDAPPSHQPDLQETKQNTSTPDHDGTSPERSGDKQEGESTIATATATAPVLDESLRFDPSTVRQSRLSQALCKISNNFLVESSMKDTCPPGGWSSSTPNLGPAVSPIGADVSAKMLPPIAPAAAPLTGPEDEERALAALSPSNIAALTAQSPGDPSAGKLRELHPSQRSAPEVVSKINLASLDRQIVVTLAVLGAVTALLVVLAFTVGDDVFELDLDRYVDLDDKLAWAIPVSLLGFISVWSFSAWARWQVLRHLGFSKDERVAIYSNRHHWDMARLQVRHPKSHQRFADGIPRKGNHILTSFFALGFLAGALKGDPVVATQWSLIMQFINVVFNLLFLNVNWSVDDPVSHKTLTYALFGSSCRMRDGILGRKNLAVVRVTSFCAYFCVAVLTSAFSEDMTKAERQVALFFVLSPTAIGDAAGEVIGSLFGRHLYKVRGIGEVNFKSYEGSLAVFLGSIIPMVVAALAGDMLDEKVFAAILIMSISSTFIEAWSLRATDNMTLPVSNALWLWLFVKGLEWIPATCPATGACSDH